MQLRNFMGMGRFLSDYIYRNLHFSLTDCNLLPLKKSTMIFRTIAAGLAAVDASHFRAVSMSVVNGSSPNDLTVLRTIAYRRGTGIH